MAAAQLNHYFENLFEQDQEGADHRDEVSGGILPSPPKEDKGLVDTTPTTSVRSSTTKGYYSGVKSLATTVSDDDKETLKTPALENHDGKHPVDKNKSEDDDYGPMIKAIGDSTKNEEKRSSRSWRSRGRLSSSSRHRGGRSELTKSEHGGGRRRSSSRHRGGRGELTKSEHGGGRRRSSSRHRGSGEVTKSEHGSSDELRRSRRRSRSKTRRSSRSRSKTRRSRSSSNNNKPTEGYSASKSPGRPNRKSAISDSSSKSPGRPRRKKHIGDSSKLSSRGSQVVTKDEISSSRHSRGVRRSGGGSTQTRSSSLTRRRGASTRTRGRKEEGNKENHSDSGSVCSDDSDEPERPKSMNCLVESFEPQTPVTLKSPKKDDQNPSRRRSCSRTRARRGRRPVVSSLNKKEASPTPNDSKLTDKEASPTPLNDNKATKDSQTPNNEALDKETSLEDALSSLPCDNVESSKGGFNAESSKGGFFAGFSESFSRLQDDLANRFKPSEGGIFSLLSKPIPSIRVQPKVDHAQPKADLISFRNTSFEKFHNSQASASLDDTLDDSAAIFPCPEDEEETVVANNLHLPPEKLQKTEMPIHSSPTKSPDWRKAMPSRGEKMPVFRSRSLSPSSRKPQQGNAAESEQPKVSGGAFNSNRADHFSIIESLDALLQAEPKVKRSFLPEPSICSSCPTSPLRGSSGKRQNSLGLALHLFEAKFAPLGDDRVSEMSSPLPRPPTRLKSLDSIGLASVQEDMSPGKKDFGSGFSEFLSPPRPPTRGMSLDSIGLDSVQEDLTPGGTKDFGSGFSSPPTKKLTSLESIDGDNLTPTKGFSSRSNSPSPKKPGPVKSLGPGEEEVHRKTPSSSRRHSSINSRRKRPDFLQLSIPRSDESTVQVLRQTAEESRRRSSLVKVHRGSIECPATEKATTKYLQLDLSNMDGEAVFFHIDGHAVPPPVCQTPSSHGRLRRLSKYLISPRVGLRSKKATPSPPLPPFKNSGSS